MTYLPSPGAKAPDAPFRDVSHEREIVLSTPTGALAGTLSTPPMPTDHAALLISGSGPTDRDGNSAVLPGKNDCLKLIAAGLAKAGIASLRFDKRGVGRSVVTPERDLRFDTLVDDAAAWLGRLQRLGRFRRLSIVGHSEGSLIGALVAHRTPVDAFISLEGAGHTAQDTLRRQLGAQLPGSLMESVAGVIDRLAAGSEVDPLPDDVAAVPPVAALFRASVQPYLLSWFGYDPAVVVASLAMPVLIVQGTNDLQVDTDDAERLAAANPRARRLLIDGMNHVLKEVPGDREANLAAYGRPDLDLAPALIPALVEFMKPDQRAAQKGASRWSA
jgi:hypothetical protein